jgi:hypothetical protein
LSLLSGCLNPAFLNSRSGGLYPTAPGDQPFVLATVINDTQATIDVRILVDEGRPTPTSYLFTDLDPQSRLAGTLIPFPFLRIAVGDLDNPFGAGTVATFQNGLTVQVPSGMPAMIAGVDFKEGDTIFFHFVGDPRAPSAIRTSAGILDGSSQVGPFGRADTFETVKLLLLLNYGGLLPSP